MQPQSKVTPVPHTASPWLLATFLVAPGLLAQSPVPVYREPRHRLVWEEGSVRVLDVQIAPGDTTLFHIHDTPILYVRVAVSPVAVQVLGADWANDPSRFYPGAINSDTSYVLKPVTHRVTNVGTTPFRLIGITNAGSGTARAPGTPKTDLPGVLEQTSSWFEASRLVLPPAAESPWHMASAPLIIVQPGGARIYAEREGEAARLLDEPASWVTFPAGSRYRFRNGGDVPATVILVAVR
jgi:hypothetical protein